jgi:uncharacterized protein YmfQ (DUF2313 family)
MNQAAYLDQLTALLPTGDVWPRDSNTVISQTLDMPASELARIDGRGDDLIEEADPRTTGEMLTDWENVAGLPDPCTGPLDSFTARRARLVQKLTSVGDQSRAYFIGIATALGYVNPTITEFTPYTADSSCTDILFTDPWCYAWRLNIHETTLERDFTANSGCSEYLRFWGDTVLECVINQLKPAHTTVIFAYGV